MNVVDGSGELVDHVDALDTVIGVVTRRHMRDERLRHRAVFVAVFDESGRLLVHRRSTSKDVWPGWCDIAIGGVVASGETYEAAARREVAEEIGVDVEPVPIDGGVARPYDDDVVSLLGRCFRVTHPGPFRFTDAEVDEAWWSTGAELSERRLGESFLPDSIALLLPLLEL